MAKIGWEEALAGTKNASLWLALEQLQAKERGGEVSEKRECLSLHEVLIKGQPPPGNLRATEYPGKPEMKKSR